MPLFPRGQAGMATVEICGIIGNHVPVPAISSWPGESMGCWAGAFTMWSCPTGGKLFGGKSLATFHCLGLLPKLFFAGQGEVDEVKAAGCGQLFHLGVPIPESLVGLP